MDIVHFAERRYAHTDAIRSPDRCQSLGDFEQQSRSVRHRATVGVSAPVGAGLNELIEQIAVGGMYLDAVEIGGLCVLRRALILPHQVGNLFDDQCARPHERNEFAFAALVLDEGLALRYDSGGRDGEHVVGLQGRMRNASDVP